MTVKYAVHVFSRGWGGGGGLKNEASDYLELEKHSGKLNSIVALSFTLDII